jgi:hypothetical protein
MAFESQREWWERLAPREKRLFGALGVTFVICIFGFVGLQIRNGLHDIEDKNASVRLALEQLETHALEQANARTGDVDVNAIIGDTAPPLATYLEGIANEVGISIPESTERPSVTKGRFHERSIDLKLRGVTLEQLAQFLKRVETRSPAVVTQRVFVKPYVSAHDKLDVELTIATYEKAKPEKGKPSDSKKPSGGTGEGEGDGT